MDHHARTQSARAPGRRHRRTSLVALTGLLTLPLAAVPALAAVTPVDAPQTIEAFPTIDMVGAGGFSGPFVIEVWRGDVKVGTSGAPQTTDLLELNHDGPPCWSGSTPDIIPGDQIRVVTADSVDAADQDQVGEYMTVANIDADPARKVALDDDGKLNDVVMTGTATTLDGRAKLELAHLAAEIVQPAWRDNGWDRKAIEAVPGGTLPNATTPLPDGGDGVLSYDTVSETNPLGNHWTAVWKNMPEPHATLALSGEQMISYFERDDGAEGSGLTITDAEDASGPGVGCPAAATDAVTATTPAAANLAFLNGATALRTSGVAYNAASVEVTVDDVGNSGTAPVTGAVTLNNAASTAETAARVAPTRQTWSATFPNDALDRFSDGDLVVSATFQRVIEAEEERTDAAGVTTTVFTHNTTPMPGRDHVLVKDTVAPAAPTAFPGSGHYTETQSVTISPDDEIEDVVRYRVGGTAATTAEPTAGSPAVTGPLSVTTTQTVKARSFDRAGNPSPTATLNYTIGAIAVPVAPVNLSAVAGNASATVSWTPPADDGGSPITRYDVQVRRGTIQDRIVRVDDPDATGAVISGLTNGTAYNFRARAVNVAGPSVWSAATNTVTPTGGGAGNAAPTVSAQSPADGATGFPIANNVTATFNEAVSGVSPTTFTLTNVATGAAVPAGVTYNTTSRVATLNPNANLATGTQYRATLTGGATAIRDTGSPAAPLATTSWTFTTATATTNPAPTVSARTPGDNAVAVGVAANTTATFNEAVTGVSTATFVLRDPAGVQVPAAVTRATGTNRWVLNPGANLRPDTRYTATLTGGATAIRDTAGAPLATTSWTFLTGPRPTISGRTPAAGATGVRRGANVTVTFREAVQGVGTTTLQLRNPAGAVLGATVTRDGTTNRYILNPNSNLAANTRYSVRVTGGATGIRDIAGNPLTTVNYTFTTGATV